MFETILAIGVMAGLSLVILQVTRLYSGISEHTEVIATRDELSTSIRKSLLDHATIISSLKAKKSTGLRLNPDLYNCVCGVGTCKSMAQPFAVLTVIDSGQNLVSPASYTERGFECDPSMSKCPLRVSSTFFAECKPEFENDTQDPAPTCNGKAAEFLAINYKIEHTTEPGEEPSRPLSGWAFVQIDRINLLASDCL